MHSKAETPGHHCKLHIWFVALAELTYNFKNDIELVSPLVAFTCSQSQLWPNEITTCQGWGELSPRKMGTHPLEPSGTLGLCSVATWRVLAEVLPTWSTEGRPQGGGSSCHLRLEELVVVMGDNDIKSMWVSHVSAQSYIPYQQCKNPLCP